MIGLVLVVSLVSASTDPHAHPQKVLVADARAHEGVDPLVAVQVSRVVAKRLASTPGLTVTSGDALRAILDAEAERQLIGCADGSCFAEIAGAMDADVLVAADVSKIGELFVVDLLAVHAKDASSSARARTQIYRIDDLAVRVDDAAAEIAVALTGKSAPVVAASPAPLALGITGGVVGVVGVAALVVGALPAFAYAQSNSSLQAAGVRYQGGDDAALKDLASLHANLEKDRADFSSWGQWVLLGGVGAVVAGAALAGAAYALPEGS